MTNQTHEANTFLSSSGSVAAADFSEIGMVTRGTVAAAEVWDQIDFATKKKLTWDDGNPRQQLVITLQTDERGDDDDDGRRRLYAKKPGSMLDAVQEAVGAAGLQLGGRLAVKYEGDGIPAQKGWTAPKLYRARYKPPALPVDDFDDPPPQAAGKRREPQPAAGPPQDDPPADLHDDDDLPF